MQNTVAHPLAPHSRAAPRLHHVTLNTGHVAEHELNGIHSVSACEFLALLEQRYGEVPGMPGFGFALSQATNCCQFIFSHRGSELVTGGLAWGPGDGESLWRWLADFYNQRAPQIPAWRSSCPLTPPAIPWLGVVLSLNLGLISRDHARMVGAVERDLALALIQRSLTCN